MKFENATMPNFKNSNSLTELKQAFREILVSHALNLNIHKKKTFHVIDVFFCDINDLFALVFIVVSDMVS